MCWLWIRNIGETANVLTSIKPRRFDATGARRIPILHTERGGWRFTALFSNTASAHQYGKIRDWVVIYYEQDNLVMIIEFRVLFDFGNPAQEEYPCCYRFIRTLRSERWTLQR